MDRIWPWTATFRLAKTAILKALWSTRLTSVYRGICPDDLGEDAVALAENTPEGEAPRVLTGILLPSMPPATGLRRPSSCLPCQTNDSAAPRNHTEGAMGVCEVLLGTRGLSSTLGRQVGPGRQGYSVPSTLSGRSCGHICFACLPPSVRLVHSTSLLLDCRPGYMYRLVSFRPSVLVHPVFSCGPKPPTALGHHHAQDDLPPRLAPCQPVVPPPVGAAPLTTKISTPQEQRPQPGWFPHSQPIFGVSARSGPRPSRLTSSPYCCPLRFPVRPLRRL